MHCYTYVNTSRKVCSVRWGHPLQGLPAHIERFRNSPVMHESVPERCKPALFSGGRWVPFPPPTAAIRAPEVAPQPRPQWPEVAPPGRAQQGTADRLPPAESPEFHEQAESLLRQLLADGLEPDEMMASLLEEALGAPRLAELRAELGFAVGRRGAARSRSELELRLLRQASPEHRQQ